MAVEKVVDKIVESGAIEKVLERIDTLALKLGTTAEHLWEILVKQAYVTFFSYGIRYTLTIIFLCCMVKVFPYLVKEFEKEDFDAESGKGIVLIIVCIACSIITIISLILTTANLTYFISLYFNPEYFAFQKIADFIN